MLMPKAMTAVNLLQKRKLWNTRAKQNQSWHTATNKRHQQTRQDNYGPMPTKLDAVANPARRKSHLGTANQSRHMTTTSHCRTGTKQLSQLKADTRRLSICTKHKQTYNQKSPRTAFAKLYSTHWNLYLHWVSVKDVTGLANFPLGRLFDWILLVRLLE